MSGSFLLVILHLHVIGGFLEGIASLLVDLRHDRCEFSGCGICEQGRSGRVGENSWVSSVEYYEGTLACRTVNPIIVGELSEQEPITPIGLSVVNKDVKVFLDLLVNVFGLSVSLQVKCGGGVQCDIEQAIELFHEPRDKLWTSVRDHSCQHSMSCVDVVVENSGPSFS